MSGFKRILKRIAIGLGLLVAVILIANAVLAWRANYRLQQRLSAIRATGAPVSIADLVAKLPPPDQNGAVLLQQLEKDLNAFHTQYATFLQTPLGRNYTEASEQGKLPSPQQSHAMKAILNSYPQLLQGIERIIACPSYDLPLNPSYSLQQIVDDTQGFRPLARFVDWHIAVLLASGKQEEAVRTSIKQLQICRKFQKNAGALVGYLIAIAYRGLAAERINQALRVGPISAELHATLDEELARQDDPERLARVLKVERALSMSGFDSFAQELPPRILQWRIRNWQSSTLDFYAHIIAVADRPWSEARSQIHQESALFNRQVDPLVSMLIPAIQAVYQASNRDTAIIRLLRILNAVCEYVEKNGHQPHGLESLAISETDTIDPFSGKPLKLKSTDDGWVIYSVMDNGTDDGGNFIDYKDWGLAPPGYPQGFSQEE